MSSRNWVGQLISRPKWYALKKQDNICLELGSGCKKGSNGWTTIDLSGADISHDLRMGIPLPSQTVDRIYTSHMFEHIPYKELVVFIDECYRVLKKAVSFPCVFLTRGDILSHMLRAIDLDLLGRDMALL